VKACESDRRPRHAKLPSQDVCVDHGGGRPRAKRLAGSGSSLDVEMQQISRQGMLIAHYGRRGMQIAPAAEPRPAQDAAHGSGLSRSCGQCDKPDGADDGAQEPKPPG